MTISPEWVTALSTIALALVAFFTIFRDEVREWFRRPEFAINFEPRQPDCHRVRLDAQVREETLAGVVVRVHSAETHYIRVRVQNVGRAGAEDVEVVVTNVRRRAADGRFNSMPMGTPWNLVWAHHNGAHVLRRLPIRAQRHIDIGHVVDPNSRHLIPGEERPGSNRGITLFSLDFFVKSYTLEYLLDPGEYEIDFQVFAANARPSTTFTLHLNHTGNWYLQEELMYRDGLGLNIN